MAEQGRQLITPTGQLVWKCSLRDWPVQHPQTLPSWIPAPG